MDGLGRVEDGWHKGNAWKTDQNCFTLHWVCLLSEDGQDEHWRHRSHAGDMLAGKQPCKTLGIPWKTYQILFRPCHIGESVRPSEHCFVGHTVSKILKASSGDAHVCLPDRSRSACAKMKSLIADQWLHSSLSGCVSPDRLFKPFEAVTENKDRNNTGYVICHHSIITVVWKSIVFEAQLVLYARCNSHNLCKEGSWYSGIDIYHVRWTSKSK